MKVKELIEELQKQNPEAKVRLDQSELMKSDEIEVQGNPSSCSNPVYIIGG